MTSVKLAVTLCWRRHGDAGGGAGGVRDVTGPVTEAVTGIGGGR